MGKIDVLKKNGTFNPGYGKVTAALFKNGTFFDSKDLIQVKYEMLRSVASGECSVTQASEQFGLSREAIYKNKAAYEAGGLQALIPKKTGPKGAHKLTPEGQGFIDSYLAEHPQAPASEVNQKMRVHTGISVHDRTVERYLSKKRLGSR